MPHMMLPIFQSASSERRRNRLVRAAAINAALAPMLVLMTAAWYPASQGASSTIEEEFVGPFASWRQVQCTGADDTAMLQNELNTLGRRGSPVLYLQPGTCRITSTLRLGRTAGGPDGVIHVTILGHHPADTRIVWAGPAGQGSAMFDLDGVAQSRFGRLTWDGGGTADIVYRDAWSGTTSYFPTGNRHEDEVFQNLWPGGGIAFSIGARGNGGSEWEYMRCQFIGPMAAGIHLGNFNALDHWVWDSLFQNVQHGVTNYLPDRPGGAGGAWGVNRSVFLNNGDDMAIGNTMFFSSRWNYSRGAGYHVHSYPIGAAASPWTSQGETIIDPVNAPFVFGSVGPLGLLDAAVRNGPSGQLASVVEGYSDHPGGDLWALGNGYSNRDRSVYTAGDGDGPGRSRVGVDDMHDHTIADPGPPALPPTPPDSMRPVIEVQNGDIAAALARAGNQRVIVHIPYGKYVVPTTLEVGPNVILTGDGYGATQLDGRDDPVLHLAGPSHAVLRDFSIGAFDTGVRLGSGILIDNADQPGGLVHAEHWMSSRNNIGWEVTGLASTIVETLDSTASQNKHADNNAQVGAVDYKVNSARLRIFNGSGSDSDVLYELHGGELIAETMFYQGGVHDGTPDRLVAPNSSGTLVLDIGNFASSGGLIDTTTFRGMLTLHGISEGPNTLAGQQATRAFGPNSLVVGYDFGWVNDTAPPTFSGPPYALWLPRHNNGGGADFVPEQAQGISDPDQFMRDHLAPLRAARPLSLARRSDDVTDVRLYRVGASLVQSGIRVVGSP